MINSEATVITDSTFNNQNYEGTNSSNIKGGFIFIIGQVYLNNLV